MGGGGGSGVNILRLNAEEPTFVCFVRASKIGENVRKGREANLVRKC
jgi:hypothetical protein